MRLKLISIGTKMPAWVSQGYEEYAKRLPKECRLELIEIPLSRNKNGAHAVIEEGKKLLGKIAPRDTVVALEQRGSTWSTEKLSQQMENWLGSGGDVSLLIGGPNGLSKDAMAAAKQTWSLSPLTLPHPMVRVLVAEQLYRAWTIIQGHPYHSGH